jgi:hypothetical protein
MLCNDAAPFGNVSVPLCIVCTLLLTLGAHRARHRFGIRHWLRQGRPKGNRGVRYVKAASVCTLHRVMLKCRQRLLCCFS